MIHTIANRSKILLRAGISRRAIISSQTATRDISIGTDLSVSQCTFQKARPWVRSDTIGILVKTGIIPLCY